MPLPEKIAIAVCLFTGFLWVRHRSRTAGHEGRAGRTIIGVFGLLPALIIGELYLFDQYRIGPWIDPVIKVAMLAATFAAVGFGFIRPRAD